MFPPPPHPEEEIPDYIAHGPIIRVFTVSQIPYLTLLECSSRALLIPRSYQQHNEHNRTMSQQDNVAHDRFCCNQSKKACLFTNTVKTKINEKCAMQLRIPYSRNRAKNTPKKRTTVLSRSKRHKSKKSTRPYQRRQVAFVLVFTALRLIFLET